MEQTEPLGGTQRQLRIIVAEDDEELRDLVVAKLVGDGHAVTDVCDGAEMLDAMGDAVAAPEGPPDVIILDVMMPGYSGLGVLLALHKLKVPTRVIMMTGLTDPSVRLYAHRFGALGVFQKPFDIDDLRTTVFYVGRSMGGPDRGGG